MSAEERDGEPVLLAELYDFAATALADPLDESAIVALRDGSLPDPELFPDERLADGVAALREWVASVEDPADAAAEVERVHTDLFVGPRPALQIHESYYADDFLGSPLAAVEATYDALGVEPAADRREEADHAAVELAALRELSAVEADRPELKRTFLDRHGWWFEALATDIRAETDHPLFLAVAEVVAGLVDFDAERLEVDV